MADSVASQIESADAVIGLVPPPSRDNHAVENTIARIVETPVALKIALLHPPLSPTQAEPSRVNSHWHLIATPQLMQDPSSLAQSLGDSFRATFDFAQKLNSRACAVVASDLSGTTVDWVSLLLHPVIEEQFDLVAPCYARHPFEGMINRAIVYPLVRALYGKRIAMNRSASGQGNPFAWRNRTNGKRPSALYFSLRLVNPASRPKCRQSAAPRSPLNSRASARATAVLNSFVRCRECLSHA